MAISHRDAAHAALIQVRTMLLAGPLEPLQARIAVATLEFAMEHLAMLTDRRPRKGKGATDASL